MRIDVLRTTQLLKSDVYVYGVYIQIHSSSLDIHSMYMLYVMCMCMRVCIYTIADGASGVAEEGEKDLV